LPGSASKLQFRVFDRKQNERKLCGLKNILIQDTAKNSKFASNEMG